MRKFGTFSQKKERSEMRLRSRKQTGQLSMIVVMRAVAVVVAIIPVAISVPAAPIFIPPTMAIAPAPLSRLMQFVAPVLYLLAVPPVVLGRFVQFVVGLSDAPLAIVIIGEGAGSACESEQSS
jgi:hypothetical protein